MSHRVKLKGVKKNRGKHKKKKKKQVFSEAKIGCSLFDGSL
jgi:hypothetical protein